MGINLKEDPSKVRSFLKEKGATYPNLLDHDASIARKYGVRGIPAVVLIDEKGKIRYQGHQLPDREVIDQVL